jgi:DNA-binding MurR/RpiR family transcriptional regulator
MPPSHRDFEKRLLDVLPQLTPKRRKLARLLLDAPFSVAFSSADEFGKHADADGATVVRFCRTLGYDGFSDLKRAIQADAPVFLTATEKIRRRLSEEPQPADLLRQVLAQDINNLERVSALNDESTFREAVEMLHRSDRIVILAGGLSAPVARTFAHLLRLIGIRAVHPEPEVPAAVEVGQVDPPDAVVAIAFWRYVRSTVRLFKEAATRTSATIAITDSKMSPLAEIGHTTLMAPTDAAELSNSLVAPMSLVNALVTALTLRNPERASGELSRVDRIYEAAGIAAE